ncbi:MAG: hypothetical protein E5V71_15850 [Mesorhizobium sp.]|nr:MAG: hypothetical protein E5V71_15850 [Mesorhizobium sp.]
MLTQLAQRLTIAKHLLADLFTFHLAAHPTPLPAGRTALDGELCCISSSSFSISPLLLRNFRRADALGKWQWRLSIVAFHQDERLSLQTHR